MTPCARKSSRDGAHILSSGNSISFSVKPENFPAMIKAAKNYGLYPINKKKLR